MIKGDSVLDYATAYINAGFQVHPCYPPTDSDPKRAGKVPRLVSWQKQHLSIEQFKGIYRPNDNLGVVMGKSNGLVCVDIDPRNGGNHWYEQNLERLGNPVIEKTGSGGLHLYYRYPPNADYLRSRNGYAPGVDILADGGKQVVTAPSIHPSSKPYVFDDARNLLDALLDADILPDWLTSELIAEPTIPQHVDSPKSDPDSFYLEQAIEAIKKFDPAIQGHAGDQQTLKAASLLRSFGLTEQTAFIILKDYYNPRCQPRWDDKELRIKVANAYKYAKEPAGLKLPENQFSEVTPASMSIPSESPAVAPSKAPVTLSLQDFLATPFHKKEHYIGPFVKQGISLVYAATGVGKTHFCIGLAFAIASGSDFLRWKCEQKARVLYIDGELPGHYLKSMIEPLYNATEDKNIHLDIITPDTQHEAMMPNLGTPEGQASIQTAIENADVIFVDNLSTLIRSGKENEAEYWLPVQSWFLKLRRMGKSVIFVHHAGKGEAGSFRGTSKITDALDLSVQLRSPTGHKAEDGCVFEVRFPKYRHFRKGDATEFQATYVNTDFGAPYWTCSELEEINSNKVIELHNEGLKPKEIMEETGLSKKTVYKWLKQLPQEEPSDYSKAMKALKAKKPTKPTKALKKIDPKTDDLDF
jgi:hypothetical protein